MSCLLWKSIVRRRHLCVVVFKNGFWKSARKCCKKKNVLLAYDSVTLNVDVMVYIAMIRTVTHAKERKLLLSCCQQLSGRISGRISGSGPALASSTEPDSKIDPSYRPTMLTCHFEDRHDRYSACRAEPYVWLFFCIGLVSRKCLVSHEVDRVGHCAAADTLVICYAHHVLN